MRRRDRYENSVNQGTWTSLDRNGVSDGIKNPFEQTVAAKYALIRLLANAGVRLEGAHAVALPSVNARNLGPMVSKDLIPPATKSRATIVLRHVELSP